MGEDDHVVMRVALDHRLRPVDDLGSRPELEVDHQPIEIAGHERVPGVVHLVRLEGAAEIGESAGGEIAVVGSRDPQIGIGVPGRRCRPLSRPPCHGCPAWWHRGCPPLQDLHLRTGSLELLWSGMIPIDHVADLQHHFQVQAPASEQRASSAD